MLQRNAEGEVKTDFVPPSEDCSLREASSQKIPKLTVKVATNCIIGYGKDPCFHSEFIHEENE